MTLINVNFAFTKKGVDLLHIGLDDRETTFLQSGDVSENWILQGLK